MYLGLSRRVSHVSVRLRVRVAAHWIRRLYHSYPTVTCTVHTTSKALKVSTQGPQKTSTNLSSIKTQSDAIMRTHSACTCSGIIGRMSLA